MKISTKGILTAALALLFLFFSCAPPVAGLDAFTLADIFKPDPEAPVDGGETTPPKKMFVLTNPLSNGGFGGKDGGDLACQADAGTRSLLGTYKALLVTEIGVAAALRRLACVTPNCGGGSGENHNWVLKVNQRYVRVGDNAEIFVTDSAGIFPLASNSADCAGSVLGSLTNAVGTGTVWTGLNCDWTSTDTTTCSSWSVTGGSGKRGDASQTDYNVITGAGNPTCTQNTNRLICVEQ